MFNRTVFSNVMGHGSSGVLLVALALTLMVSPSVHSQYADHLQVKVEHVYDVQLGQPFSVSINLENDSAMQIGGFDLLLAFDANLAALVGVQQGQLLNDCIWEYFTYRTGPFDCNGDCPSGLVRLVAIADLNNGSPYPNCFAEPGGQLASLEFIATSDSSQKCGWIPVSFFWLDCGDNGLTTKTGDVLFVSDSVFLKDWVPAPPPVDTFPNYTGTPEHCLDSAQVAISRRISFYGNGADILCSDTLDKRGDINLNGLAYEIEDWGMFTVYFYYGLMYFHVDYAAQIAATDCNADGLPLTLADLVYMGRVVEGDTLPILQPPASVADTVFLIQDTLSRTITVEYQDNLSALYLIFDGEVDFDWNIFPLHAAIPMFEGGITRALITPNIDTFPALPLIESGLLFEYVGNGQLIAASAAYSGMKTLPTVIYGSSVPVCCLLRGDVNGDRQINVSDLTFAIAYLFASGPPPGCFLEADVDGWSALLDVSDMAYMVNYLFRDGPPPALCP